MIRAATFEWGGATYRADLARPHDLSLPLRPDAPNPNCYWADAPAAEVIRAGNFVGSVALGGAVNYRKLSVTPHGNGTHTECYGHISPDPEATLDRCLDRFTFFAHLLTVRPEAEGKDRVIRLAEFRNRLPTPRPEALVLRTLPNGPGKRTRQYSGTNPPYLEPVIGQFLADNDVLHLLVDLPSVDREVDGGKLFTHRSFWRYPGQIRRRATITELVYVADDVPDGAYLLQLHVPQLAMDAAPSRPVLYPAVMV
ncbi:MAG: cyclase family protein [Catalinimonas sp.]